MPLNVNGDQALVQRSWVNNLGVVIPIQVVGFMHALYIKFNMIGHGK